MLIDKDMKKKDLCAKVGISTASVTKMGKGGHVTTEVLAKICAAMDCGVDDIMEIVLDESEKIEKDNVGNPSSNCKARMKQFEESRKQHKEECIWLH